MRLRGWPAALLLLASCHLAAGSSEIDAGGADVTVALFTTSNVRGLLVRPEGPSAWIARCANCAHSPLRSELHLTGPSDVFAGGSLEVRDAGSAQQRSAVGLWHFRAREVGGGFDVVLTIPSERYVENVLSAEALPDEPRASLEALAILARTFALNGRHFTAQPGHLPAQLCDSTECQAMRFGPVTAAIEQAVRSTAGETLWFHERRAEVFFSQNCGGIPRMVERCGLRWPGLRTFDRTWTRTAHDAMRRGGMRRFHWLRCEVWRSYKGGICRGRLSALRWLSEALRIAPCRWLSSAPMENASWWPPARCGLR